MDNHKAFDPDMGSSLSSRLVSGSGGERSFENMDRDVLAGAAEPGKGFFYLFSFLVGIFGLFRCFWGATYWCFS